MNPYAKCEFVYGVGHDGRRQATHCAGSLGTHSRTEEGTNLCGNKIRTAPLVRHTLLAVFFLKLFFVHAGKYSQNSIRIKIKKTKTIANTKRVYIYTVFNKFEEDVK